MKRKLAAVAALLLIALALLSLAYLEGKNSPPRISGSEEVNHYLINDHRGECYPFSREIKDKNISFDICMNEDGLRDKDYRLKKPPNTYRVITLGDWITFGWVENNETWPNVMERRLNARESIEKDVEVINFGRSGLNTYQEVNLMERKGIRYSPDLVTIQFMDNDAKNQSRVNRLTRERFNGSLENVSAKKYRETAKKVYEAQRQKRLQRDIEGQLRWGSVLSSLERLENMSEKHDFRVLFIYYTTYSSENYMSYLENRTTQKYGWEFMEVDLEEKDRILEQNLTHRKTWDLTAAGHRQFAYSVEPRIEGMISGGR